ncbi:MAG: ATP-dependent RecD-like DNA helicase [bacterium]|nr:ATP-dependent RecD-like DNA helicase [bacterium]
MDYIKGNYKKSIFNGENGYIIGLFKVKESSIKEYNNKTITFTGYFHEINESDTYLFNGEFVNHYKYGEQFNVFNYERIKPEEKDSIVEFLTSGLFKGIGKKKAEKIVGVLGEKTLEIIIEQPDNLLLIPTITQTNIDVLHNTLIEYESSYTTILKLNDLGFNTKDSMIIYNKYKQKTLNIIDNNLYTIYFDIKDISYKNIDRIALSNNYDKYDSRRISACIYYVFEELTNTIGNSYYNINDIYTYVNKVIGEKIEDNVFIDSLNTLILDLKISKSDDKYYLTSIKKAEDNITKRLAYLTRLTDNKYKKINDYINSMEIKNNITYDEEQKIAIKNSMEKNLFVITGGPGSGKTTIIKSIVDLYMELEKISRNKALEEIALLAPTGRASKRLSESTLFPSTTIHRFLKWNKETDKFSVNEYNKAECKFVIIDEASMVDTYLMDSLLRGLKIDTRIVIVGDYNQLPSVGPGQVLKDIIDSDVIEKVTLNKLHRQNDGSNIIDLAYDINNGIINEDIFNKKDDLVFIKSDDIPNEIKKISKEFENADYKDFQILVPMYKTINGIDNLNKILQGIFNPKEKGKNEIKLDDVIYREGDKVLQLTNMPDENVFNGDIGIISYIEEKQITIDFDGNYVKYTPSNYKKFKHAYAISIHKSQGSEFSNVIIPISKSYSKMLYRKLYYTAVTRSKRKLILIGDIDALKYASSNNLSADRSTTLKDNLIKKLKIENKDE